MLSLDKTITHNHIIGHFFSFKHWRKSSLVGWYLTRSKCHISQYSGFTVFTGQEMGSHKLTFCAHIFWHISKVNINKARTLGFSLQNNVMLSIYSLTSVVPISYILRGALVLLIRLVRHYLLWSKNLNPSKYSCRNIGDTQYSIIYNTGPRQHYAWWSIASASTWVIFRNWTAEPTFTNMV